MLEPADPQALNRLLPEAPTATPDLASVDLTARPHTSAANDFAVSAGPALPDPQEKFHWKALLWQSLAFQGIEHGPRILSADAHDRRLLLNKPFWSDYWASLGQYNMRRWNDGDSFVVNYIGHPMQGAVSGDLEIQNNPRDRLLRFSNTRPYWASRGRALLWETAYSVEFEIGPLSEDSIFNQGGYTYPLGCHGGDTACEKTAKYTNNTGWVDFIVTPVGGTALLVAQDMLDRYVSDPLIDRHPGMLRYRILRGSLNPSQSLANALRGRLPWYRDYDDPMPHHRIVESQTGTEARPSVDVGTFYSSLSLPDNDHPCRGCRVASVGGGAEVGIRLAPWADFVTVVRSQSSPGSLLPLTRAGSLQTAHFGLRTGYAWQHASIGLSLLPGLASYSNTGSGIAGGTPAAQPTRRTGFSALATLSGDLRFTRHVGFRATVEQMILRYQSPIVDPPGRGTPPRLSYLSHENYINSTNWGVRLGPVFRF